jgi:hypothetical protein
MNPDIIHALEVAAIVVAGTLTGSELTVAVFFHPRIGRLEDVVHVQAVQALAKVFGTVMPFWYALTFLLALAVTFVAHATRSTPWWLALASTVLFALIIVYSVLLPVPINNQVVRWQPDSLPTNWRDLRRRWDLLHAIRVVFLVVALVLLVTSCVI